MYLFGTAYNGVFIGPIAKGLGWIMNGIYVFMSNVFGIDNVAVAIILFTFIIYMALMPLTYQQQKFSILTRKMQPEMQEIQKKYQGKKDQDSMMKMNEETQALYAKYGISPSGSCIQMLIQMPLLFALYRVFYNVPAYLKNVKNIFTPLVTGIVGVSGYKASMQQIYTDAKISGLSIDFVGSKLTKTETKNYIIDVLYKLPDSGWKNLKDAFPTLVSKIADVQDTLRNINYIGNLNISDTPWNQMKAGISQAKAGMSGIGILLFIGALLIPILCYVTQLINMKMAPQTGDGNDSMAKQMKIMNYAMPLMSFFIAFTTPVGLGVYWIAGAVVRSVQQFFLNRHFEKIDLDAIIEKNKAKAEKKQEKRGIRREQLIENATLSTKRYGLQDKAKISEEEIELNEEDIEKMDEFHKNPPKGSLAEKASLVYRFNNNITDDEDDADS